MSLRLPALNILARPELLARLAPWVTLLLVLALAHSLARLTWQLLPLPSGVAGGAAAPVTSVGTANGGRVDYQAIIDWHLFGQPGTEPVAPPAPVAETPLNLRLGGVFYGLDIALIGEASGEEKRYSVGDLLPGGARLEAVLERQVILSRDGRRETLSLPKDSSGGSMTPLPGLTPATAPAAAVAATAVSVDASAIAREYGQSLSGNPQALQDLAFAVPYVQNGQFVGFRLRPGRKRELFAQLGLQSGDVITELNGIRLDNPAQAMTMLQGLASGGRATAKVLRNGTEIPLTFAFNPNGAAQ
ncbi:MAG TPA: type II secretion system protein N [Candidatus Competibacteraceae bacterium]|nr:type II secretion system protein N [Candidatus Competibacteraceae bacterium]